MCFAINNLLCEVYMSYTKKLDSEKGYLSAFFVFGVNSENRVFLSDCILA